VLHQADRARRRPEPDQVFAHETHAQGRAVWRRQLVRAGRRYPILAHQVAHERTRADATQGFVVLLAQHVCLLRLAGVAAEFIPQISPIRPRTSTDYSTKISTDGRSLAHSVMTL